MLFKKRTLGLVILGCCLAGCIPALMQKSFDLIPPNQSWAQMDEAPKNSAEILASASDDEHFRSLYEDWDYKKTWFQHGDDDYILYFQLYSDDDCGDQTYGFKNEDGRWTPIHGALGTFIVCGR